MRTYIMLSPSLKRTLKVYHVAAPNVNIVLIFLIDLFLIDLRYAVIV